MILKTNSQLRKNNIININNIKYISTLCTMVRIDEDKKNLHLAGSSCLYFKNINFESLGDYVNENRTYPSIQSLSSNTNGKLNIVILNIFSDLENDIEYTIVRYDKIVVINIGILAFLKGDCKNDSLFSRIFINTRDDNNNKILKTNPLFIFNDIDWPVIVYLFKLRNIVLSGGFINVRHKTSTLVFYLIRYLELITLSDEKLIKYCLINNMKRIENTSAYIDKNIYEEIKIKNSYNSRDEYDSDSIDDNLIDEHKKRENRKHAHNVFNFVSYNKHIKNILTQINIHVYAQIKHEDIIKKIEEVNVEYDYVKAQLNNISKGINIDKLIDFIKKDSKLEVNLTDRGHKSIIKRINNPIQKREYHTSHSLNNNNKFKWLKLLIIFIISIISMFILPSIFKYYPSSYDVFVKLFSISIDPYWIKYSVMMWLFGWLLFYIFEFYLYLNYTIDSNINSNPKYLPKFILNLLNQLKSKSEITGELKNWITLTYIRFLLFNSFLIIVSYIILFIIL